MNTIEVECPNCKKKVAWIKDNEFRPFCCERCKLIDLGEWASGGRYIKGNKSPVDNAQPDSEED